jgi:sugar (pentulose or hexulose) kinase
MARVTRSVLDPTNCVGISSSDLECLDFLNLEGRVTAGRLAEVTGLPVRRAREAQSTGLGCAMLAAVGAGAHADLAGAARAMCGHETVAPDDSRRDAVDAAFRKWRELSERLEELSI